VLVHPLAWAAVVAMWAAVGLGVLFDLWVLWRSRPALTPRVPSAVGVGDTAQVPVGFALGGRVPLSATLRPEVDEPLAPGADVEVRLPPGESEAEVPLLAPQRGAGELRALWLRLSGPLGLVRRVERVPVSSGAIRVIPNARRVRELALAHFGAQPLGGGLKVERRAGDGGEFDAMATYVHGMDVRKVDWKSSARHQDLHVRRYRLERNQRLVVCVDTGRTMSDPIDGVQRLDHAIHAAMVLSQTALRAGDLVGLHAYGAEPERWVAPAAGIRHAARITEACSTLEPSPVETNHVLGIHALLRRLRRRSLVVMFTDFADSTTAELMVEHLGHLARRHLILFVALDDPIVEEPLARAPASAQDLAAATVAAGLRHDRQRVLRRLSRMGVDVIHGPPGPATLRLLARYVHIKRRGLIG
jgi:uncharacterized protein (DUF58 family)